MLVFVWVGIALSALRGRKRALAPLPSRGEPARVIWFPCLVGCSSSLVAASQEIRVSSSQPDASHAVTSGSPDPKRWRALFVIAMAQLMVILDASIVNIALPSAQADLGITDSDRQWVVTAYTLAFGGLLLLGGRIADYWGRKRAFILGLLGFAFASALGGLAPNAGLLFGARALQGVFAALLAPAALSLITITFTESKERARAFGVYGGISGGGAAIGLIVGGVLTEYASWRWCLLVNVPFALIAVALAIPYVHESRAKGDTSYDIPGADHGDGGSGHLGVRNHQSGNRRMGRSDHHRVLRDSTRAPCGLRRHRVADAQSAPPAARSGGSQPRWLVPHDVLDRWRSLRHVPAVELLLPRSSRLLRIEVRLRVPAVLHRGDYQCRPSQPDASQVRSPPSHLWWFGRGHARHVVAHPAQHERRVRHPCPPC